MEIKKIAIIGAESTGKTTLACQLAEYYGTTWLPEYARQYVENLKRPYNYDDICKIAEMQPLLEEKYISKSRNFLFLDTDLIITKVWFQVVYKNVPVWIDKYICDNNVSLYLICNNDLEWCQDGVRENGGEKRNYLLQKYIDEVVKANKQYKLIEGQYNLRLKNAINSISEFYNQLEVYA